jgi:hypothetical protein
LLHLHRFHYADDVIRGEAEFLNISRCGDGK